MVHPWRTEIFAPPICVALPRFLWGGGHLNPTATSPKARIRGNDDKYCFAGCIAPDLSHACGLHRPGYDRSPASPNPARNDLHGAAQIRRGQHNLDGRSWARRDLRPTDLSVAFPPRRPIDLSRL